MTFAGDYVYVVGATVTVVEMTKSLAKSRRRRGQLEREQIDDDQSRFV